MENNIAKYTAGAVTAGLLGIESAIQWDAVAGTVVSVGLFVVTGFLAYKALQEQGAVTQAEQEQRNQIAQSLKQMGVKLDTVVQSNEALQQEMKVLETVPESFTQFIQNIEQRLEDSVKANQDVVTKANEQNAAKLEQVANTVTDKLTAQMTLMEKVPIALTKAVDGMKEQIAASIEKEQATVMKEQKAQAAVLQTVTKQCQKAVADLHQTSKESLDTMTQTLTAKLEGQMTLMEKVPQSLNDSVNSLKGQLANSLDDQRDMIDELKNQIEESLEECADSLNDNHKKTVNTMRDKFHETQKRMADLLDKINTYEKEKATDIKTLATQYKAFEKTLNDALAKQQKLNDADQKFWERICK